MSRRVEEGDFVVVPCIVVAVLDDWRIEVQVTEYSENPAKFVCNRGVVKKEPPEEVK